MMFFCATKSQLCMETDNCPRACCYMWFGKYDWTQTIAKKAESKPGASEFKKIITGCWFPICIDRIVLQAENHLYWYNFLKYQLCFKAVDCDICARWTHIKCTGYITESQYHDLCSQDSHSDNFSFICSECSIIPLPFNTEELITGFSSEESGDVLGVTRPTLADPDHFDCFQKKGLHFIHMNARSLLNKSLRTEVNCD